MPAAVFALVLARRGDPSPAPAAAECAKTAAGTTRASAFRGGVGRGGDGGRLAAPAVRFALVLARRGDPSPAPAAAECAKTAAGITRASAFRGDVGRGGDGGLAGGAGCAKDVRPMVR